MRKLIVIEFISLDGVMQAPGGPEEDTDGGFKYGGWTFPYFDETAGKEMSEQMSLDHAELLLGQKTYEIFAGYWPQHAGGWPGINKVKKYVASHDPKFKPTWENSILLSDVAKDVKKLKSEHGSHLCVWGSGNLIQTLLKHDLVDELWLKIFPVTLGSGKKLFAEGTLPVTFKLTRCSTTPSGVILARYVRDRDVEGIKTGTF
jgi:dihydrofolate reductase